MNGEPGRPLLVSLLLYLDDAWPPDWAAETLFLDSVVTAHFLCCMLRERQGKLDSFVRDKGSVTASEAEDLDACQSLTSPHTYQCSSCLIFKHAGRWLDGLLLALEFCYLHSLQCHLRKDQGH